MTRRRAASARWLRSDLLGGGAPGAAGHQAELGFGAAHAGQARRAPAVVGGGMRVKNVLTSRSSPEW